MKPFSHYTKQSPKNFFWSQPIQINLDRKKLSQLLSYRWIQYNGHCDCLLANHGTAKCLDFLDCYFSRCCDLLIIMNGLGYRCGWWCVAVSGGSRSTTGRMSIHQGALGCVECRFRLEMSQCWFARSVICSLDRWSGCLLKHIEMVL